MVEPNQEKEPRRDPLAELEARIDAAIEEVRPKVKRALEELDARVDSAMSDLRPRVESAMEDVKPRVDRFLAEVQPRLDSALRRIQNAIAELRKDLEERASRKDDATQPRAALPRSEDAGPGPGTPGAEPGAEEDSTPGGSGPYSS